MAYWEANAMFAQCIIKSNIDIQCSVCRFSFEEPMIQFFLNDAVRVMVFYSLCTDFVLYKS